MHISIYRMSRDSRISKSWSFLETKDLPTKTFLFHKLSKTFLWVDDDIEMSFSWTTYLLKECTRI